VNRNKKPLAIALSGGGEGGGGGPEEMGAM
jgi:hypothetical protein